IAWRGLFPRLRAEVVKMARPFSSGAVPRGVAPSRKVTLPVGVPASDDTRAIRSLGWPKTPLAGAFKRVCVEDRRTRCSSHSNVSWNRAVLFVRLGVLRDGKRNQFRNRVRAMTHPPQVAEAQGLGHGQAPDPSPPGKRFPFPAGRTPGASKKASRPQSGSRA